MKPDSVSDFNDETDETDDPALSQRCVYFNRIKDDFKCHRAQKQLSSDKSSPV